MKYFTASLLFFLAFAKWCPAQSTPQFQAAGREEHYVLILLSDVFADPKEIAGRVARYNQLLPSGKPVHMQLYRIPFLGKQPVITLSGFANQNAAEAYCQKLIDDHPDFLKMRIVTDVWPVALSNFNEMLRKKSAEGYPAFLQKFYAAFL